MFSSRFTHAAVAVAGLLVACGGGGSESSPSPSASEDERGAVGDGNPASVYCQKLGFTLDITPTQSGVCTFPDGTSCEEWAFFRGQCGQAHSYCNQHGGTVSNKTEETMTYAECNLNGKVCKESSFFKTGKCE